MESPKRPSKLIFVVLKFMTATSPGAWHCCTSDDIMYTPSQSSSLLTETWTNKDRGDWG